MKNRVSKSVRDACHKLAKDDKALTKLANDYLNNSTIVTFSIPESYIDRNGDKIIFNKEMFRTFINKSVSYGNSTIIGTIKNVEYCPRNGYATMTFKLNKNKEK